jgi:hypothetical protein
MPLPAFSRGHLRKYAQGFFKIFPFAAECFILLLQPNVLCFKDRDVDSGPFGIGFVRVREGLLFPGTEGDLADSQLPGQGGLGLSAGDQELDGLLLELRCVSFSCLSHRPFLLTSFGSDVHSIGGGSLPGNGSSLYSRDV